MAWILAIILTHLCHGKLLQKDKFQSSASPQIFVQMFRSLTEKKNSLLWKTKIQFFEFDQKILTSFFFKPNPIPALFGVSVGYGAIGDGLREKPLS